MTANGKTVLVTGGSRGIGAAIARQLAACATYCEPLRSAAITVSADANPGGTDNLLQFVLPPRSPKCYRSG
jgi:NAD(P)-dependent dehydrogenase (short-subunit alcohol dehydrogenase family)